MLTMNVFPNSHKVQVDFADINTKLGNFRKERVNQDFNHGPKKSTASVQNYHDLKIAHKPSLYGPMA